MDSGKHHFRFLRKIKHVWFGTFGAFGMALRLRFLVFGKCLEVFGTTFEID
jgi:hypothetical protein